MALSDKTLAEMAAGARTLAEKQGAALPADYMEKLHNTHLRASAMRRWERDRQLAIEIRWTAPPPKGDRTTIHHVLDRKGNKVAEFIDDPQAIAAGGYPSEILIANIALAIAALGGGDV